ncbi:MAG: glutathione S-transferase N-terminal domain-containing protein [Tissierellia bacterium]|nr:glutathione S-transferase N-terminal domain-containing protein [Tissierellia bacterium]
MSFTDFTLFFKPECPYCMKVLNYLNDNDIRGYKSYNIEDETASNENKKKLEELGGKVQVPFLVTEEKSLYESDDIIEYFKENFRR